MVETMTMVLVGVGTWRQEQAKETAVLARPTRHAGVALLPDGEVVETLVLVVMEEELVVVVGLCRLARASVLTQVVTVTASAVWVYVVVGAVTTSTVTIASVVVGAVTVSVPVVAVTMSVMKLVLMEVAETVAVLIPKKLEQNGVASAEADKTVTTASTKRHLGARAPERVLSSSSDCTPGRAAATEMLRRAEATTERILLDSVVQKQIEVPLADV